MQIESGDNEFNRTYVKNSTHARILTTEALFKSSISKPLSRDMRVEGEASVVTEDDAYSSPGRTRLFR
jgi:hypothetical protein